MTTATIDAGNSLAVVNTYEGGTDGAATTAIYSGEGNRVGRRQNTPQYQQGLTEALRLYDRVLRGNRYAALQFQESMSRSDFQYLFGDVLDRQLLAAYQDMPVRWDQVARRGRVRDFRVVKRYTLDGGRGVLSEVKELAPYTSRTVTDGKYEYSVKKYGAQIPISWETVVNDDLDALGELPDTLGLAARRTEERFATSLYAGASGPNSTFYSTANKNVINSTVLGQTVTANPALSIGALQLAMQVLAQQLDSDGGPIYVESVVLEVPPALEVIANNIVNAVEILAATGGGAGTGNDQLRARNWMANRLTVKVNPWLPVISSTANGNTSWYLHGAPRAGRPAMEVGFLIGHETPELWMKSSNAVRVGGGVVAPQEGDFEHDGIQYRVRHVLGGTLMDPKSSVASNGSGS